MKNEILTFIRFILPAVLPFLASCKSGNAHFMPEEGDTLKFEYARNIQIVDFDGYKVAIIRNPWDTTKILSRYYLVPRDSEIVPGEADGKVVRVPLESSLIYSSVHNSLVTELGAIDAIKGVCDAQYIHQADLSSRIESGEVVDCGNSMSPDLELIISLSPDAILLSPFENSGNYGKLGQLGIPIIECADYMETSPLGRAEWMKFYGMLFGRENEANAMFEKTKKEYNELKESVENVSRKPKVLIDRLYGSSWHVPGAHSTMGIFIEDAGGENPFRGYDRSGSIGLSGEEVLFKGGDSDVWLIRYSQSTPKTLRELSKDNAIYSQFKAFDDKRVYGCNTSQVMFYEEVPFHPQWLLKDMITIIQNCTDSIPLRYYTPMN